MRHESRAMAMPTPGNFPDSWEDKNEKDENDEIEKGQESESWTKEAWNVFKNKLDEYSSGRVGTGIKMYAGDTVDFVKTSTKETVDFVKSKVEALSKSDRLTLFNGFAREGTFIVAAKNDLMEKVSENFSYNFKNKELREHFQGSAKVFKDEKEKNYSAIDKLEKGEARDLERIKGAATGAGTLIKYAKLTAGTTTPLGIALMGTMTAGHHSEVAKNARLRAESVIEKTRVGQLDENGELIDKDDLDRAWEEANKIYNEALAKSKDGEVSAKDLDKAYQENLPKDILERIGRNENYEGLSLLQKGMIWNMEKCAKDVEAEFMKIESSDKTEEEKEAEKQVIIERNKKLLEELDGMVSDQGIVDSYAYLARAGEKTGKAATLLVTLGITTEGIHKAWDSLKEVNYSRFSETVVGLRSRFNEYVSGQRSNFEKGIQNYRMSDGNAIGSERESFKYNAEDVKKTIIDVQEKIDGAKTSEEKLLYKKELVYQNSLLKTLEDSSVEDKDVQKYKIPNKTETVQGVEGEEKQFKTLHERIEGTKDLGEKFGYMKEPHLDKIVQDPIAPLRGEASESSGASPRGAEQTAEKHFQIAEKFEAEKNNNIWSMGEKYLRGNHKFLALEGEHGTAKALETYNIDRIKDEIVAHPEKYGLRNAFERILGDKYEKLDPADRELFLSKLNKMGKLEPIFRKLTVQDLNSINWQDAFDKEFLPPASKGITETLTDQQIKGVLASNDNEYEKRFGHEHHGGGKGRAKVPGGIDAPPHATAVEVPNDLATHEKVPVEAGPIDDTKIFVDSNLVIDKDSQFGKEYPEWAKRSADDFLHRRYGEALTTQKVFEEPGKMDYEKDIVHVRPDAQEMRNREELRGRLENARHIIGDPKKGETVGDFMARYNNENAGVNKALYDGLANSAALNGNADVKAEVWSIVDKMPGELKHGLSANFATNKEVALGYVKLFFGDRAGVSEGIKKFFDYQGPINPESIKIKPDGSILYENAFGKNNYDLQISKDKVGVDGPLFNNMKKTGLSLDSIKNAKSFIIEGPVSKTVAEATMDMSKEGEVVGGKGTEVIKPEEKMGAGSEKVGAVVEKNIGSGKGKMLDISTESEVEKGVVGGKKMIDLSESSHEEKFNQATAEKIKTIDSTVSGADKKNFDALVSKFNKYSDNDLVKAIESAKSEEEKKLIAKAIAKVMEQRNLEDEKNF